MDNKMKDEDLDIEIILGDDSELNFSDIRDSIKTLRPKDKVQKGNIIIPKSKMDKEKKSEESEEDK